MERKAAHDRWLESALGAPPYEYAWGGITSLFDLRTGSSTIVIRYAKHDAEA